MMFSFFRSKLTLALILDAHTHLGLLLPLKQLLPTTRYLSSLKLKGDKESFTVSYLINNCGLSPDAAKSASKYVLFANPKKPDAVLALLRDLGVTHMPLVIEKCPRLLLSDANKILQKLRFLRSIGFSVDDLQKLASRKPSFMLFSLERSFMPLYDILKKRLLLSDERAVVALKRLIGNRFNTNFLSVNLSVLEGIGMPTSIISLFITRNPVGLCRNADKFNEVVKQVVEMGFDPSQYLFASALRAKLQLSKTTWNCKIDALTQWGLSEDEIFTMFRKCPLCIVLSAESIRKKMDFLENRVGWPRAAIINDPIILTCSLEKRIVPRCSVIRVLSLRGLIKGNIRLDSALRPTNDRFLAKYVSKHQEQVPELLDIFQGKLSLEELGIGFDGNCVTTPEYRATL